MKERNRYRVKMRWWQLWPVVALAAMVAVLWLQLPAPAPAPAAPWRREASAAYVVLSEVDATATMRQTEFIHRSGFGSASSPGVLRLENDFYLPPPPPPRFLGKWPSAASNSPPAAAPAHAAPRFETGIPPPPESPWARKPESGTNLTFHARLSRSLSDAGFAFQWPTNSSPEHRFPGMRFHVETLEDGVVSHVIADPPGPAGACPPEKFGWMIDVIAMGRATNSAVGYVEAGWY